MQRTTLNRCIRGGQAAALALLTLFAYAAQAQPEPGTAIPDDYYRAEFIILERIVEPQAVEEHMRDRAVTPTPDTEAVLWSEDQAGNVFTTLDLAPATELHLNAAAQRLERSGRYRVLAIAGWYEAFPPNYEGTPLRVEAGDWIDGAGQREIEGLITIDRQRYLHVDVHLNHWQVNRDAVAETAAETAAPVAETVAPEDNGPASVQDDLPTAAGTPLSNQLQPTAQVPLELLTWIRETRRMRSEEIHFLDSPTIGVLVFFKKIEATE